MKKAGVLLALLMLFSLISFTGKQVSAIDGEVIRVVFELSESYDIQKALSVLNQTNSTYQYDETTWVILDGQNVIIASTDMWDLFKEPSNSAVDSSEWKADSIASQILQKFIDGGVVSADAYYRRVVVQTSFITNAKYVYIVHYFIKNAQKREFIIKLAYPRVFWRMYAFTAWDHGQTVVNIYDYLTEDNTVSREYYYKGTGKPHHTREGEVLVNTWQSYIQNKSVAVYTETAEHYVDDSWMHFRLVFFSNEDYSTGIEGINGHTGVASTEIIKIEYEPIKYNVKFSIKDALTGQGLSEVKVKEGDAVIGTIDDGGILKLPKGVHNLTFEKSGYWSVQKTVDVQGDTSVTVEMYPSSAAFIFKDFPSNISIPENTIYTLSFTISPIDTSGTYNTYLTISGLSDILEVRKNGQLISPESGKYYLGDIGGDTQISIKFKAGSVGTHSFTVTLTSNDAIASKTYTTSKQVVYKVEPLPFSIQFPSEWQVGANELRISESSGQSYLITVILRDKNGTEVWSDSHAFGPYEAYTFQVNVPSEGFYTLELQWNGQVAVFDIQVNPAITLLIQTITAREGDIATVQVKIRNPSSETKYYTIVLEGPIIEGNVSKSVSVAPLSEKTVDLAFQVPNDLTYDAYDLTLKVLEGDSVQFQDTVHLIIDNSGSGFSFPIGEGSDTWLWVGVGVFVLLLFIAALRRR